MARDFIIQCGADSYKSIWLRWFVEILSGIRRNPDVGVLEFALQEKVMVLSALEKSMSVQLIRQRQSSVQHLGLEPSSPPPLFQLFSDYEGVKCLDQRDKVFGLYSLAPTCCKDNRVDYSLTWETILASLVRHQIDSHHSLPKSVQLLSLFSAGGSSLVAEIQSFFYHAKALLTEDPTNDAVKTYCAKLALAELSESLYLSAGLAMIHTGSILDRSRIGSLSIARVDPGSIQFDLRLV
jgi:hypothetical protein